MSVNTLKTTPQLTVVPSPYLHDDRTPKTIAEILGKSKDEKRELQDFSEAIQSRVKVDGDTITLKIAEGNEKTLGRGKSRQELTSQSGNLLSKSDIIVFIQEAFGKNYVDVGNENFFMLGGKDDAIGQEIAEFFHKIVGLDSGKHYWLSDTGLALYIDTQTPKMLYIVKLDSQSTAYSF